MPLQKYLNYEKFYTIDEITNLPKELGKFRSVGKDIILPYTSVVTSIGSLDSFSIISILSTFQFDNINFTSYFEFKGDIYRIVDGNPAYNEIDGSIGNDYISIATQLYSILNNSPNYKDYSFTLTINVGIVQILVKPIGYGSQYAPSPIGLSSNVIDAYVDDFGYVDICLGQKIDFSAILICNYLLLSGINGYELDGVTYSKKYSIPFQSFYKNNQNPFLFNISNFISTNLYIEPIPRNFIFKIDQKAIVKPNFILYVSYRDTIDGQLREYFDLGQEVPEIYGHISKCDDDINIYVSDNVNKLVPILTGRGIKDGKKITYETLFNTIRQVSFINNNLTSFIIDIDYELNDSTIINYTEQYGNFNYAQISISLDELNNYVTNNLNIEPKNIKSIDYKLYASINNITYNDLILEWKELITHELDNSRIKFTLQFQNSYGGFDSYSGHENYVVEVDTKKDLFQKNIKYGYIPPSNNYIGLIDSNEFGVYNNESLIKYKITLDPLPDYELDYILKELSTTKSIYLHLDNNFSIDNRVYIDTNTLSYIKNDLGQVLSLTVRSNKNLKTINNISG